MNYAIITLITILVLCVVCVLTAYICFRKAFTVRRERTIDPYCLPKGAQYNERREQMLALIRGVVELSYVDIYTRASDGTKLHARYYESAPGAPIQILFHGYRSNALRDFSGGLQFALCSGCNALLVDQRAHGQSEGDFLTFGIKEREDCLAWVRAVNERWRGDAPIILVGISMGAATVLMASSLALPRNVVGIIADSAYTSPAAILRKVMRDRRMPVHLLYPFLRLGAKLFGRFDPEDASSEIALRSCRIPVLFIHGGADDFVPCEMSRTNYRACAAKKELLIIPGAGHGLSYLVAQNTYCAAVSRFLSSLAILHSTEMGI